MNKSLPLIEFLKWKPHLGPWGDRHPADYRIFGNDIILLEGVSGAGKSLLLRSFVGLDHSSGERLYCGGVVHSMPEFRKKVQFVPQFPVFESGVSTAIAIGAVSDKLRTKAAAILLELGFSSPESSLDRSIVLASGGERLRYALVRALLVEPQVLMLDEWSAGLDREAVERVRVLILNWINSNTPLFRDVQSKLGRGVLMTAHHGDSWQGLINSRWSIEVRAD